MTGESKVVVERVESGSVIRPPNEFDFSKPEAWATWIKRFQRYLSVSNLSKKSDAEKIDVLCYTMGEKAEEILAQVMPTISGTAKLDEVIKKFSDYFEPKKNIVFERFKFNSRTQQIDETVDSFITALYTLADSCKFGDLKDELIRDRIVIGMRDTRTSERLQLAADLTVEKALDMARQAETQSKEGKKIREEFSNQMKFNRLLEKAKISNFKKNKGNTTCGRCGLPRHQDSQRCPAEDSKCRKCSKVGHWQRLCR